MVRLKIDGVEIETQDGKTILEAAGENGIYIPSLCWLSSVNPLGSCRVCLVEVEGVEKPIASCTSSAVDGIVVRTKSERLTELRRKAIELISINHPLDCPVCDKSGECRLQNLVYEFGVFDQGFQLDKIPPRSDYLSPLIERNEPRCIRCGRCVSVCHEVQGRSALRHSGSGYPMVIDTTDGGPLNCDFCGQCIFACPVGALLNKQFKARSKPWELGKVDSICPYCGAGCRIKLNVKDGKVDRVTPFEETATSVSPICGRSAFGCTFIHSEERLRTPLIRKGGKLVPASWDEALDFAAQGLKAIRDENGPDAIAGIASARATNEDNYLFQRFFRQVLGSNNLDSYSGLGYAGALSALMETLGSANPPFSFRKVEEADVIMVVGTDLPSEMPVPSLSVIRAARDKKAVLINAYPRETKLDRVAHFRLRHRPGSEIALIRAFAAVIIQKGLEDRDFITSSTVGFDDFAGSISSLSVEEAGAVTGLDPEEIVQAAMTLAKGKRVCIILGYDLISQARGRDAVLSLANLALIAGLPGKEGSGLYLATEKNNQRGVVQMGCTPDLLPGFKELSRVTEFEKVWGKVPPVRPGKAFSSMIRSGELDGIRALYVMGSDPLAQFPNSQKTREALSKLRILIVQDIFPTKTMELAHCVLPAASFAEKEGTFTQSDGNVQRLSRAIDPIGSARPDWQILSDLCGRMGSPMAYGCSGEITDEIGRLIPGYLDTSVATPFSGKGRFIPVDQPAEEPNKGIPFTLMIGPTLFHCGTLSTHSGGPQTLAPDARLEMNPEDLAALNLTAGQAVKVSSEQGSIQVGIHGNERLPRGTLFLPHHHGDAQVHLLTKDSSLVRVQVQKA